MKTDIKLILRCDFIEESILLNFWNNIKQINKIKASKIEKLDNNKINLNYNSLPANQLKTIKDLSKYLTDVIISIDDYFFYLLLNDIRFISFIPVEKTKTITYNEVLADVTSVHLPKINKAYVIPKNFNFLNKPYDKTLFPFYYCINNDLVKKFVNKSFYGSIDQNDEKMREAQSGKFN